MGLIGTAFGCDRYDKEMVPFRAQDLTEIQSEKQNGCFRLPNKHAGVRYLFLDVDGVQSMRLTSQEDIGRSHVHKLEVLTKDGRLYDVEELVFSYEAGSDLIYEFPQVENLKAIRVTGHTGAIYDADGRQRVDVSLYDEDGEGPLLRHANCNMEGAEEIPSDPYAKTIRAFRSSWPVDDLGRPIPKFKKKKKQWYKL